MAFWAPSRGWLLRQTFERNLSVLRNVMEMRDSHEKSDIWAKFKRTGHSEPWANIIVSSPGDSSLLHQECMQEGRIQFPFISKSRRNRSILDSRRGNTRHMSELQGKRSCHSESLTMQHSHWKCHSVSNTAGYTSLSPPRSAKHPSWPRHYSWDLECYPPNLCVDSLVSSLCH